MQIGDLVQVNITKRIGQIVDIITEDGITWYYVNENCGGKNAVNYYKKSNLKECVS